MVDRNVVDPVGNSLKKFKSPQLHCDKMSEKQPNGNSLNQ